MRSRTLSGPSTLSLQSARELLVVADLTLFDDLHPPPVEGCCPYGPGNPDYEIGHHHGATGQPATNRGNETYMHGWAHGHTTRPTGLENPLRADDNTERRT